MSNRVAAGSEHFYGELPLDPLDDLVRILNEGERLARPRSARPGMDDDSDPELESALTGVFGKTRVEPSGAVAATLVDELNGADHTDDSSFAALMTQVADRGSPVRQSVTPDDADLSEALGLLSVARPAPSAPAASASAISVVRGATPAGEAGQAGWTGEGWKEADTRAAGRDFAARASAGQADNAVGEEEIETRFAEAFRFGPRGEVQFEDEIATGESFDEAADAAIAPFVAAQAAPRRAARLVGGALALALAVGAAGAAYVYVGGQGVSGEPVVVEASQEPVKVRPEQPGGLEIANQDSSVYRRVSGDEAGETQPELRQDGEAPLDVASIVREEQIRQTRKSDERLDASQATEAPQPGSDILAPRKVSTFVVKPDGTIVGAEPAVTEAAAEDADRSSVAAVPTVGSDQADDAGEGAAAEAIETAALEPVAAANVPQPRPADESASAATDATAETPAVDGATAEAVAASAGDTAVGSSEWVVQLASQRSEGEAQTTFQTLQKKFPALLSDRAMAVQRADVEGRGTFFRIRVLTASRDDALGLCSRLKTSGASCFVTR